MRTSIWSFAKGSHCLSVGFLAASLTGLMQPADTALRLVPAAVLAESPGSDVFADLPAPAPATPATSPPPPQSAPAAEPPAVLPMIFEEAGVPESPYGDLIYRTAARHAVNPYLVVALIQVESAFNPRAISRKGARGLMQLLPGTARRFGLAKKRDLFNPAKNLEAGIRYLQWLSARFSGDTTRVLAAYNAGEGAVDRFGGVPPFQETRNYVTRIFSLLGLVPTLESPPPVQDGGMIAGR